MSGPLYVGVDVGSSMTKCVVLDAAGTLVGHDAVPSGFDYREAAQRVAENALQTARQPAASQPMSARAAQPTGDHGLVNAPVARCVATGYGRQHVEQADRLVTEITCHARGAREWYPQVRNIVDIGGQDTKVICINEHGLLVDYRMNAKCAAGTGAFLESIAVKLGLSLRDIDALAMASTAETMVNSYCTVFAGTEVIERIKEGHPKEDISMGLFRSIAARVGEMIASPNGQVGVTGGVVAHCRAMVRALEEVLGTKVLLPPMPQHAGAYGAALIARQGVTGALPGGELTPGAEAPGCTAARHDPQAVGEGGTRRAS